MDSISINSGVAVSLSRNSAKILAWILQHQHELDKAPAWQIKFSGRSTGDFDASLTKFYAGAGRNLKSGNT